MCREEPQSALAVWTFRLYPKRRETLRRTAQSRLRQAGRLDVRQCIGSTEPVPTLPTGHGLLSLFAGSSKQEVGQALGIRLLARVIPCKSSCAD